MTGGPSNPQVIIIGAGTAGLAAAARLQEAGTEVLVLEAAGHIGGRCVTNHDTFSVPFDEGCSWLHSGPINPLAPLATAAGKTLHKAPWEPAHVQTQGYTLTAQEVDAYAAHVEGMWDAIEFAGQDGADVAIDAALPPGPFAHVARNAIAQMLGGDADVTSARDSFNYAHADGDWLVEGGLGSFVKGMHRSVPVRLNCPVQMISTAGHQIEVTTPDGTLRTDRVILTVSTGVLAAGAIRFDPPLPDSKARAIEMLPNGLLNKIGIEFDPGWAEATQGDMAEYHTGGEEYCSILFGFFDTGLAVAFVAGRFAQALEKEGPGAATDYCLQGLQAIFGTDALKFVRQTAETAWHTNPLTYGSYSFARPGGTPARETLAQPIDHRLFFAGEATMTHTYSTVHGAHLSGQRAAAEVLASLG